MTWYTTGGKMAKSRMLLPVLVTLVGYVTCQSPNSVDHVFTSPARINHVTVNKASGVVYVGAVNALYQLSTHLDLLYSVDTGPRNDNANCEPLPSLPPPPGWCECENPDECELHPTDSITKSLVVDEEGKRLIVCSSLYQGYCEKRSLANIRDRDLPIYTAQVPSDATSSTVMFIASGPQPLSRVLYVAAERSTNGLSVYKDLVPAVCSRNLSNFQLAFQDFRSSSRKNVESQQRDVFRIQYVHGFASGDYSYFLMVQKDTLDAQSDANYGTHMARVCQRDDRYYSYTEIPLRCGDYNLLRAATVGHAGAELAQSLGLSHVPPLTDVDQVLVGVFSRGAPHSTSPLNDSVLCLFTMRNVRSKFTATIQDCFQGKGNTGPPHIAQQQPCIATSFRIDDSYCGIHDMNTPIATSVPLNALAVVPLPGVTATAVALTFVHDYTVALVGTQQGSLLKVVLEPGGSQPSGVVYETVDVEAGNGLLQDVSIVSQDSAIIASDSKVYKIRLQSCSRFLTCETCHSSGDPFCGWCSLTDRCGPLTECPGAVESLQWLPYNMASCPSIGAVLPPQTQIYKLPSELQLSVLHLPMVKEAQFECSFSVGGVSRETDATVRRDTPRSTNMTLLCRTPNFNLLPPIPTGEDHFVVRLSVRMNGKDHVFTDFTFFDCAQHQSCTKCTSSRFPCTWCVQQHRCTSDSVICHPDILITGTSVPGVSDHPGPAYCPRIDLDSADDLDILVPADTTRAIRVQGIHLQTFQTNLRCRFDGGRDIAATRLSNDVIECADFKFQYQGSMGTFNVRLQVVWGEGVGNVLDNPSNIQVKVYKCEGLAPSCGQCLTVDPVYDCGWCDNSRCTVQTQCASRNWLDTSVTCPNPSISMFSPDNGPCKGGTLVTIDGLNLGKTFADIRDGVTVGGVKCEPVEEQYVPSIRIVCVTGARSSPGTDDVKVVVTGDNKFVALSTDAFTYVEPRIEGFEPRYGPQSGGSYVTIRGFHLNTGTSVKVLVATLNCAPARVTKNEVVCVTSPAPTADLRGYVEMKFDEDLVEYVGGRPFTYTSDPVITGVSPMATVVSGGLPVVVTGRNLNVVQQPRMIIYTPDGRVSYSTCDHVSNSTLTCWTPGIGEGRLLRRAAEEPAAGSSQQLVTFGFMMDGVMSVRNVSGDLGSLTVYPDPHFDPFAEPDRVKTFLSQSVYLTINGRHLLPVFNKENLVVKIGDQACEITSVSATQLTCKPPDAESSYSRTRLSVTVEAGRNVSVVIGALVYDGHEPPISMQLIFIILGCVMAVVGIIVVAIIFTYRHKSRQKDLNLRRQMDNMEARMAKECKEAFAELQTDMTEFTSDISGVSIPFLNYRAFCMRILFPNESEAGHPVLNQPFVDHGRRESVQRGLSELNQLMGNRTFLLLFVRTLEKQPDFAVKSRVRVASLLSVVLQHRMEYHTEILKTLLADLVDKLMEDHNPKLLLRRTESVAEKMLTNWFAFLLYRFLRDCAGEQLFVLFQAIKQQVEKGPVDEITGEARYALSEDKLIRQQVDFSPLTVQVREYTNAASEEQQVEVSVKVLDCDTISQVKEKIIDTIYKTVPFSFRPTKDQRDLYLVGPRSQVLLQDEDASGSSREEDYRKLNTLADYRVTDGATMFMTERHSAATQLNSSMAAGLDRSDAGSKYVSLEAIQSSVRNSPSLSRSGPTQVSLPLMADIDDGLPRYHLVKPHSAVSHKTGERNANMVSEVYLARLLKTKLALQSYVDTLFETLFSTAVRGHTLPLAIKYMFDFLDDQAIQHGTMDAEVVHTWKSNCLPLRFWVGVIKNPDHVFDIHKTNIVDSCLSIVAQTFMDSCSMSPHNLGKDSPSSKLLYAKEIPKYKTWVSRYYQDIKQMPAISDQDMAAMLAEESHLRGNEFNVHGALYELYQFVSKYHTELLRTFSYDESARNHRLDHQLNKVRVLLEPSSNVV